MPAWIISLIKNVGAFLAPYIFNWIKSLVLGFISYLKKKSEDRKAKKEALEKYTEAIKNPNLTQEEKDNAKADFLNS